MNRISTAKSASFSGRLDGLILNVLCELVVKVEFLITDLKGSSPDFAFCK